MGQHRNYQWGTPVNRFHYIVTFFAIVSNNICFSQSINNLKSCNINGISINYFNGVDTTQPVARESMNEIAKIYGFNATNGQEIKYSLMYNDTKGWRDFVETFSQRLLEHNGLLADRFELFLDSWSGNGNFWSKIIKDIPSLAGLQDLIKQDLSVFTTNFLISPTTKFDYQRHRDNIDASIRAKQRLLFFAHSQGNLFANAAYGYARTQLADTEIKVVHVAPASVKLTGPHVLADLDVVIKGLRNSKTWAVAEVTGSIPVIRLPGVQDKTDPLGHGLLAIYLNRWLEIATGARGVDALVKNSLKELLPPSCYSVKGTLTGLAPGSSITLSNTANKFKEDITMQADGAFVFPTKLANGVSFSLTQSPNASIPQRCRASSVSGRINASDTDNLTVTCDALPAPQPIPKPSYDIPMRSPRYALISDISIVPPGCHTSVTSKKFELAVGERVDYLQTDVCYKNLNIRLHDKKLGFDGFDMGAQQPVIDTLKTFCRYNHKNIVDERTPYVFYKQGDASFEMMFLNSKSQYFLPLIDTRPKRVWKIFFAEYIGKDIPYGITPNTLKGECAVHWKEDGDSQKYFSDITVSIPNVFMVTDTNKFLMVYSDREYYSRPLINLIPADK